MTLEDSPERFTESDDQSILFFDYEWNGEQRFVLQDPDNLDAFIEADYHAEVTD